MKKSSRLVFFGNERLVSGLTHTEAPVLHGLIRQGYDVAAVVVNHTDGVSRNARSLEVAELAKQHNIPLFSPSRPLKIIDELIALRADAAILCAYGRILPQRIIDVFKPAGIINIHPSLLPRHRGPTPIETTILAGDEKAGVSIMQLTAGMDEGPVFAQTSFAIAPNIKKSALYSQLSKAGCALLFSVLPDILSGSLQPKPQTNIDVSVTSLISKLDGMLDPTTEEATVLERKVRAYQDFPKPHMVLNNHDVIITSAAIVGEPSSGGLVIPCAHKTWLEIEELIAPSGRRMSGDAYLRGYAK